jgi:asparagine synthase (glutamine-hydrolysing)
VCGIVGALANESFPVSREDLVAMLGSLAHRGPDDAGLNCCQAEAGNPNGMPFFMGMGACRLSLLDFIGGAQPFQSSHGSTLVFNGEIYNWKELRTELRQAGQVFRTSSDTEVLLALWEQHGLHGLRKLDGMFAFAIREDNRLTIARDPYGMKPLYFAWDPSGWFAFASEAKALLRLSQVTPRIDCMALFETTVFGHPLGQNTYLKGISQVRPGTALQTSLQRDGRIEVECTQYGPLWREADEMVVALERSATVNRPPVAIAAELRTAFVQAVDEHLVADHPVGIFLSGGLDSSILLGAARASGHRQLHTFTFGDSRDLEDVRTARLVAERMGCQHHEILITFAQFLEEIPRTILTMEAPRAPVGSEFLAREACKHVKAALCGEGCDELFGGYWSHADPITFLKGALQRHLQSFRRMALSDPECAAQARSTLRRLAREDSAERQRNMWLFQIQDQLCNAHLLPWDHSTMGESLELRLPYLSQRMWQVVSTLNLESLGPLGSKRLVRLLGSDLLPSDIAQLINQRRKIGFPNNINGFMARLRGLAAEIVPEEHIRQHPLRRLPPIFPGLMINRGTRRARGQRSPEKRILDHGFLEPAEILILDLFLIIFCLHRGSLPEGLSVMDLYTSPTLRSMVRDALEMAAQDLRLSSLEIEDSKLLMEAL